jgi:EAL domain-containing protein (putative c-di-GMP-specific phosphodiesterase class I)
MTGPQGISWRTVLSGRTFVVAALVIVVGVALFAIDRRVDAVLTKSLRSSAEQGASATAKTLADFALSEKQLKRATLGPHAKAALREQLRLSSSVEAARLWSRDGSLVLDTAFNSDDSEAEPSGGVLAAFDGTSITRLTSDAEELEEAGIDPSQAGSERDLIEVYLPIAPAGGQPRYVIEAFLNYQPSTGLIAGAHHSLDLLLTATSVLLFIVLTSLIIRAARRVVPPGRDFKLERRLLRALRAGHIETVFQPKIALQTGEVVGVEALVRWRQTDGTLVVPGDFLPPIENSDAMHDLTLVVLDQAIAQLAHWRAQGLDIGTVAVNIPSQSLLSGGFEREVHTTLERYRVAPEKLTLELTEASIVEQPEFAAERIAALRGVGVDVSIDDFGTRHSSLARISQFDVSELKIDRAFVSGMRHNEADLAVVQMVIDLGKALGLRVVAEGIETDADAEALIRMGCPIGQGFLYARPMQGTEICAWTRRFDANGTGPADPPTPPTPISAGRTHGRRRTPVGV